MSSSETARGGLPPPLSASELKITDLDFVEAYSERNGVREEAEVVGSLCCRSPGFAEHYRHLHRISTLQRGLTTLKHACSDQSLYLMPEFQKRLDVLRELRYIDEQETVLMKGRVACEVTSSESLLVTELIFQNVLSELSPEECVSLLSCLVFQEKVKYDMTLTPTLEKARARLLQIAHDLAHTQVPACLPCPHLTSATS
jgi:antiviral helicase SKI2